jgi:hypothetical protein
MHNSKLARTPTNKINHIPQGVGTVEQVMLFINCSAFGPTLGYAHGILIFLTKTSDMHNPEKQKASAPATNKRGKVSPLLTTEQAVARFNKHSKVQALLSPQQYIAHLVKEIKSRTYYLAQNLRAKEKLEKQLRQAEYEARRLEETVLDLRTSLAIKESSLALFRSLVDPERSKQALHVIHLNPMPHAAALTN